MDNFTTLETAIKLRDAGFPQPGFKFGQLWMTEDERNWAFVGTAQFELLRQHYLPEIIFRPTATDILREMGEKYSLLCIGGKNWIVNREINTSFEDSYYEYVTESAPLENDGNPAEAAAAAYLNLKNK